MNKKRVFLLALSLSIILGIGIASGAIIATQQSIDNKTNTTRNRKNYSKIHEKSNKKKESSSNTTNKNEDFDKLPQKTQLALLINHHARTLSMDKPMTNTHYFPLMGIPNKIVIINDGGVGTEIEHAFMITDNHDGTYSLSTVESTATTVAFKGIQNSWWKFRSSVSKKTLMEEYANSNAIVNEVESLINLSRSDESFTSIPETQETKPANADQYNDDYYVNRQSSSTNDDTTDSQDDDTTNSQDDDTTDSQDDDTTDSQDDDTTDSENYYYNKAREPNADYYLPDGTHIHNDDQGHSIMDDGTVIGK